MSSGLVANQNCIAFILSGFTKAEEIDDVSVEVPVVHNDPEPDKTSLLDEALSESMGVVDDIRIQPTDICETEKRNPVRRWRSSRIRNSPGESWKSHCAFAAVTPDHNLAYNKGLQSPELALWEEAITSEIDSLRKNHTWTLLPRESAGNLLSGKLVFKTKKLLSKSGNVEQKFKALLVARVFQLEEMDCNEAFASFILF